MVKLKLPIAATLSVVVSMAACYRVSEYSGDGQLSDRGLNLKGHRYLLDLGPIDLAVPGTHSYRLENLPDTRFTAGIELMQSQPIPSQPDREVARGGIIRMTLTTSDGDLVIREEVPLQQWTWSGGVDDTKAFLYLRGESRELPVGDNVTKTEHLGVKAREGWGSYFVARKSDRYHLRVEVLEVREEPVIFAKVILYGD